MRPRSGLRSHLRAIRLLGRRERVLRNRLARDVMRSSLPSARTEKDLEQFTAIRDTRDAITSGLSWRLARVLLLVGVASAIVAILASVSPRTGTISLVSKSRGVRLVLPEATAIEFAGPANNKYDVLRIEGVDQLTTFSGRDLLRSGDLSSLRSEGANRIARMSSSSPLTLYLEPAGGGGTLIELEGVDAEVSISVDGGKFCVPKTVVSADTAEQCTDPLPPGNVIGRSVDGRLSVVLERTRPWPRESGQIPPFIWTAVDALAVDHHVPVGYQGIQAKARPSITEAVVRFDDFGGLQRQFYLGDRLRMTRGTGTLQIALEDDVIGVAFTGHAARLSDGVSRNYVPSWLEWLWGNPVVGLYVGALLGIGASMLALFRGEIGR